MTSGEEIAANAVGVASLVILCAIGICAAIAWALGKGAKVEEDTTLAALRTMPKPPPPAPPKGGSGVRADPPRVWPQPFASIDRPASGIDIRMPPVKPPRSPRHEPSDGELDAAQRHAEEVLGRPLPADDVPRFRAHVRSAYRQFPR